MRFSTRLFLAISSASVVAGVGLGASLYRLERKQKETDFAQNYEDRGELLAVALNSLEESAAQSGMNAARQVRDELDASKGRGVSQERLKKVASLHHDVALISLVNSSGKFTDSTGMLLKRSLFDLCPDYRNLITGTNEADRTPFVPDLIEVPGGSETGVVSLFTLIPMTGRQGVIDVGVRFTGVQKILKELAQSDPDLLKVSLYSPTGILLGEIQSGDSTNLKSEPHVYRQQVKSSVKRCCECEHRGLSKPGEPFHYDLVLTVSPERLYSELSELRNKFLIGFVALLLLSLALAAALASYLAKRLESLSSGISEITENTDFSRRLPVREASQDEIDALSSRFNGMLDALQTSQKKILDAQAHEARAMIASQVAHDIRSPLTSMSLALDQLKLVAAPEILELLKYGIQRVSQVAGKLTHKKSDGPAVDATEVPRLTLLDEILRGTVSEQSLDRERAARLDSEKLLKAPIWTVVQVGELQTALSNILNNAFEATPAPGRVELSSQLSSDQTELLIDIVDQGKGIPLELVAKIFDRGVSVDKPQGSGLGLFQARQAVQWSGGKIEVTSQLGQGTRFRIHLPVEKAPDFVASTIPIPKGSLVAVLDDDPSILAIWKSKFQAFGADIEVQYFASPTQYKLSRPKDETQFPGILICDHQMGDAELRGLAQLKLSAQPERGYLCTSLYDSAEIQNGLRSQGLKLIPKPWLSVLKLQILD